MLCLTSVSASEVVIGDVAGKLVLPCQRVRAVSVAVCHRPDSNRRWLTLALKATDLDHLATTLRQPVYLVVGLPGIGGRLTYLNFLFQS